LEEVCLVRGSITTDFLRRARKKRLFLLSLLGVTVVAGFYAITQGAYEIPLLKLLQSLVGQAKGASSVVVWKIRLPRIVASLVSALATAFHGMIAFVGLSRPIWLAGWWAPITAF
jgi:iron complex transport system permease protein